jgi:putative SOS response-associated peptidase YedK
MCGRFALKHQQASLQEWYETAFVPAISPRYNIAPSMPVLALRDTTEGRVGAIMRWGLIPAWAKDPSALPMLHNARGETLMEKPMFRQAFKRRRCLIPASGFYEWKAVPGQRSKQPFYVSMRNGNPMAFAGLWERSRGADGEPLESCTIVTTSANAVLEPIHHRMPLVLDRANWNAWLGADTPEPELLQLIQPSAPYLMQAWGVSHAVNKVGNDNETLIQPIASIAE